MGLRFVMDRHSPSPPPDAQLVLKSSIVFNPTSHRRGKLFASKTILVFYLFNLQLQRGPSPQPNFPHFPIFLQTQFPFCSNHIFTTLCQLMISLQQVQGQQFKGISLQGKIKKNLQVEGYSTMTKMTFMFTKPKITFLPQISEILNSIPVSFSNPYLQPVGKNAKIIVTKFCSLASFVTTGLLPITEVVNNRICVQTQLFPIFTCFRSKSSLVNQCF